MTELISVVIPTYNRYTFVLNAIHSIKNQTYKNIEIIVVNDKSSQGEYYTHDWEKEGVQMIHLEQNTRKIVGFPCGAYVRNKGIEASNGKYIAFCDDDDIWFPKKLELQINAMKESGCAMSSTDGLHGHGVYNPNKKYPLFNAEKHYNDLRNHYRKNKSDALNNGFPKIWNLAFLKIHNCVITSSVVMEKELLTKINNMKLKPNAKEDYDCWLRALVHTDLVYVYDSCFYYDADHGSGKNY